MWNWSWFWVGRDDWTKHPRLCSGECPSPSCVFSLLCAPNYAVLRGLLLLLNSGQMTITLPFSGASWDKRRRVRHDCPKARWWWKGNKGGVCLENMSYKILFIIVSLWGSTEVSTPCSCCCRGYHLLHCLRWHLNLSTFQSPCWERKPAPLLFPSRHLLTDWFPIRGTIFFFFFEIDTDNAFIQQKYPVGLLFVFAISECQSLNLSHPDCKAHMVCTEWCSCRVFLLPWAYVDLYMNSNLSYNIRTSLYCSLVP